MERHEKREHWQKVVADWKISGDTKKDFCHNQNLAYASFLYWCNKLGEDGIESGQQVRAVQINPAAFLSQKAAELLKFAGSSFSTQGIMIPVNGGKGTITVQGMVTVETLARILSACGGATEDAQA